MYQVTVRGFLAEDLAESLAGQIRNGAPESLTVEVGDQTRSYEEAARLVRDTLDAEGHGDDCVRRCLRNECEADHGCEACADEDEP